MSVFDKTTLFAALRPPPKSEARKRRLARRLLERQQKNKGEPSVQAPSKVPSPPQIKAVRIARHERRFRRKIKRRQELAARSGLPELVRRSNAGLGRGAAAKEAPSTAMGLPTSVGGYGHTEETDVELPQGGKCKPPQPTRLIPLWEQKLRALIAEGKAGRVD